MSPKSDGVGLQARDSGSYTSSKGSPLAEFPLACERSAFVLSGLQLIG